MNNNIGLVLEGGGFRGLYTAGILDCMLAHRIVFPYTVAVSMGASNATNYLAEQTKRNLQVPYTLINDSRYLSYARLLTKGELFGMNFIFNEVPNTLIPFDFKTFVSSSQKLVYVCTDCLTGEPYYVDNSNTDDAFKALEASTSLPFASKMVKLHNRLLLDGGIADPIPVKKALADGCKKLVIILTQPKGYRKASIPFKNLAKARYRRFPLLTKALLKRHLLYNKQLALVEQLEAQGSAYVFRPAHQLPISRTEKNKQKLKETFDSGHRHCMETMEDLMKFIDDNHLKI
ncbi:Predicted phospholipase, patatin/cPLA2 family [Saccharicrinis carchari]|uniref:Predicted phospholipase, patatin/cPLA2 family n=1 Tax=Saccharicrinis carchari TaxID=1168039 RepID=A0A521CHZ2_SACCC|nr:patatin family protein [Saccharicrinis carchari]SMO59059.1 Predicted phospholipase, patatin/cPLA2 family [Saccharicrinis carchari]